MGANTTGRTATKWIRFCVTNSADLLCEIPINKISVVGLTYEEQDMTAYQDAVKGALPGQPDAPIEISGPFSIDAAQAAAGSGLAPALSGSHTVLNSVNGSTGTNTPLTIDVRFGMRQYWTTNEPQFGITGSATDGYYCTSYVVDGTSMTYTAKFVLAPGSAAPAWGTGAES